MNNIDVVFLNKLKIEELNEVATWISESKELELISGIKKQILEPDILNSWIESSKISAVAKINNNIIGMATLTSEEANIPNNIIEICHCIVKPEYRRYYNGSQIVLKLMSFAKDSDYLKVVGRVMKYNKVGQSLLKSLNWDYLDIGNNVSGNEVHWLEKKLK